jgi:hypothetical protein
MTVRATYNLVCNVNETLDTGVEGASNPLIQHDAFNVSGTLHSASTPPATKAVVTEVALVAGSKTVDLTALVGTNGAAVTFNGLRVQLLRIRNKTANAGNMTFTKGASNGWTGLGASWASITLEPGAAMEFYLDDGIADVSATVKNIDVTGTGTEEFELTVVAG